MTVSPISSNETLRALFARRRDAVMTALNRISEEWFRRGETASQIVNELMRRWDDGSTFTFETSPRVGSWTPLGDKRARFTFVFQGHGDPEAVRSVMSDMHPSVKGLRLDGEELSLTFEASVDDDAKELRSKIDAEVTRAKAFIDEVMSAAHRAKEDTWREVRTRVREAMLVAEHARWLSKDLGCPIELRMCVSDGNDEPANGR